MTTGLLFLSGAPETIGAALRTVDVSGSAAAWAGIRAADDPMAGTPYGSSWPYGGFVLLDYDGGADAAATGLAEVLDQFGDVIDRRSSMAIVGTTHTIIDGRTDIALVYLIHRIPALTPPQYQDHWLNRHGPLAKKLVPTSGYEQTHADLQAGSELAKVLGTDDAGFDGNATCYFGSLQDFVDMLDHRQAEGSDNAIYQDERLFIDHAGSIGALMRRVAITDAT